MARESTFPADDVEDRTAEVLAILTRHHPVPVPLTNLYLGVTDKRALADGFQRLEDDGRIERAIVRPGEAEYEAVARLAAEAGVLVPGPLGVYRLPAEPDRAQGSGR
jgi:hypothetical protein